MKFLCSMYAEKVSYFMTSRLTFGKIWFGHLNGTFLPLGLNAFVLLIFSYAHLIIILLTLVPLL